MYKKVVVEEYSPKGCYKNVNPFTTCFCRTLLHGQLMLTGGYQAVKAYLPQIGPALISYTYWGHGGHRSGTSSFVNVNGAFYLQSRETDKKYHLIWVEIVGTNSQHAYHDLARYGKIPSSFPRVLVPASKDDVTMQDAANLLRMGLLPQRLLVNPAQEVPMRVW